MPRYFFDIANSERSPDQFGTELDDPAIARAQAVIFAGSYLRDHPELLWGGAELRVSVRDEAHGTLFIVVVLGVACHHGAGPS